MSSVFFDSAMRVISQVFNWLQSSGQSKTSNLIIDAFQSGIDNATSGGEGFTLVPGTSPLSVTVEGPGIAYDIVASRIFIDSLDTTVYNPSNVTATTNDGLGNFISTPQSSGVVNIPLTPSVLNYLWIDYLATTDTSVYTLNEITQAKIFYKLTDGYNIRVTTVNTPPDSASIFLGTVNAPASGIISGGTISQIGRQYFNILPNIVPIVTAQANRSDATVTYNPASSYTLEAHIKAVGTSPSGVSPTNPHAMTLADLGVGTLDTVVGHRQLEHGTIQSSGNAAANAIIAGIPGTPSPTTSAMATQINIVNPGSDYLTVFFLLATEFAIVNGSAYNTTDIFGGPSNATVFFPNVSGTYNVYWDSVVKAFSATTSDISADVTKLWLCTVTYTYVGSGPSDHNALSGLIDLRRIGSTTHLLQRWFTGARPGSGSTLPASGEFGFNLTTGLMEYWDGSAWQQPVNSSSNTTVPTGSLLPFAGASAPTGFLLADGSSHLTASYPNLFAVIGYTYGGAGGNFNVPNMVNNAPIGAGSIAPFGTTVGSPTHTLTTAEIPATPVTVSVTDPGHPHAGNSSSSTGTVVFLTDANARSLTAFATSGSGGTTYTLNNTNGVPFIQSNTTGITASGTVSGGGGSHSVVQPSIGVNYIIKT